LKGTIKLKKRVKVKFYWLKLRTVGIHERLQIALVQDG
jgi:hypothetical protein